MSTVRFTGTLILLLSASEMLPALSGAEPKPLVDHLGDPLPDGAIARLGTRRLRGLSPTRLVFSPDGRQLGCASYGDAVIIDPRTGKEMRRFTGGSFSCLGFAFLPDGKHVLAVASWDRPGYAWGSGGIGLWEVATGKLVHRFTDIEGEGVWDLSLSDDGKVLAVRGKDKQSTVTIWDVPSRKKLRTLPGGENWPYAVTVSPDGKFIAIPGFRSVSLYDVGTGEHVRELADVAGGVWSLTFSPDGKIAGGAVSHGDSVQIWDVQTGKLLRSLKGHKPHAGNFGARSAAFSADGKVLYTGGADRTIRVWEVATGKQLHCIEDAGFPVALSPDGTILASGSSQHDWSVRLWDAKTFKPLCVYDGHRLGGNTLAYSPDGKTIATGGGDEVYLWDIPGGKYLRHWEANRYGTTAVRWSSDGKTLLTVGNEWKFWDAATGKQRGEIPREKALYGVSVFHPTEKLVIGTDSWAKIRFHDYSAGEDRKVIESPQWPQRAIAISSDGKRMAVSCDGLAIEMWDLMADRSMWKVKGEGMRSLVFSPDGQFVYYDTQNPWGIAARRTRDGKEVLRVSFEADVCTRVALSGDGRALAALVWDSQGRNHHIRLIETSTGRERRRFGGHDYDITDIAFAPDGRTFATVSSDCTGLVWDALGITPTKHNETDLKNLTTDELWHALCDEDAALAHRVMAYLLTHPDQAIELARKHVQPARTIPAEELDRLILTLVDDKPDAQRSAQAMLRNLQGRVEGELRTASQTHRVPEVRKVAAAVLDEMDHPLAAGSLRGQVRAVEVLGHLGTKEAVEHLNRLATGAPQARSTREAKASLERCTGNGL